MAMVSAGAVTFNQQIYHPSPRIRDSFNDRRNNDRGSRMDYAYTTATKLFPCPFTSALGYFVHNAALAPSLIPLDPSPFGRVRGSRRG